MNVFYGPDYVASAHAFDTTRKAEWLAASLSRTPIRDIDLVVPQPLTATQVATVHDIGYVQAVQTGIPRDLAESQGFAWDDGLWSMVLASNGGVVAAALDALEHAVSGSLSSGLHHARRERGDGYCTFNGLAIAAMCALDAGVESVLILDLDAHCGGGTASLIGDDERIWHLDTSVSSYDSYESSRRASLKVLANAVDYLDEIRTSLNVVAKLGPPLGLCLYNAGMDPFEGCDTGGLPGITREMLAERERMVFDWCRVHSLPVAFVLAGGYVGGQLTEDALVDLHRLTLAAAARPA